MTITYNCQSKCMLLDKSVNNYNNYFYNMKYTGSDNSFYLYQLLILVGSLSFYHLCLYFYKLTYTTYTHANIELSHGCRGICEFTIPKVTKIFPKAQPEGISWPEGWDIHIFPDSRVIIVLSPICRPIIRSQDRGCRPRYVKQNRQNR